MFILNLKDKPRFSFHSISILAIIVLIGFYSNLAAEDSSQSSTNVSSVNVRYKYQEIKELGKKPANQITSKELEKLVEKSTDFVSTFPEYKRVDEVYYYLGTSLVRLERVEEGIKVFEKSIMEHPETRFVPQCLLELGLAYDKLGKHDKGDETYKKLIDHSKFGSRSQAKQAKMMLELDKAERNGELPQPAGAEPSSTPNEWVGKPAPGFQVKDLNGKELSLKKLHGQVVLLDFWATWCGPCIAEMPNVKKTYEKYKDQKFQIIGISLDRSIEPLKSFVKKEGLAWHQYFDNARILSTMYQVNAIPSTFLIDGEGIIRKTNLRGRSLETAVAALVKENLAIPAHTHPNTPEKGSQPQSIPATKLIKMKTDSQTDENLESRIANPSEWVGKPAPDFQVKNIKGEELSLKDFRGQVVFLDFWATWCGPCIAEMPKVKKTYEKYKDQKFEIIGISLDRSQPPLDAYVEKEGLTWHHYWDENRKIRNLYEVKAIPTAFLIDGEGIIRKASLGGFDVESAVAALVKENLAKPADTPPTKTPADSPEIGQNLAPKVKEIIDAAIAAHGGLEKLESVKNFVMESRSFEHFPDGDIQDEGRSKSYYFASKFRSDSYSNSGTDSLIYDGTSLFQLTDKEVVQIPPEKAKSFVSFFKDSLFREPIWLLTTLSKDKIPTEFVGMEEVNGVPTSVLLVTQPSGKKLKVFISEETNYIVQFSFSLETGEKEETVIASFDKYQDVDGIKIAHHRTTKNGEYRQILITDIKFNAEIDDALFRPNELDE